ncbi:unnamed protein product [Staurois parvus]|uniref:Uncharacterized protein n=1 Tax=Staurois parvus TaxID=386267 RepID=A0ABN9DPK1_9NEOB|nr:unnamed protein product [Staurois parvus]
MKKKIIIFKKNFYYFKSWPKFMNNNYLFANFITETKKNVFFFQNCWSVFVNLAENKKKNPSSD